MNAVLDPGLCTSARTSLLPNELTPRGGSLSHYCLCNSEGRFLSVLVGAIFLSRTEEVGGEG